MPETASLPYGTLLREVLQEDSWTALDRHAARHPYDPWIFHPEPPDWRWLSLAEGLERIERLRATLAGDADEIGAVGQVVAFRYLHEVSRLVADLAIRAAGLISAPLSAETLSGDRGISVWLDRGTPSESAPGESIFRLQALEPRVSMSAEISDRSLAGAPGCAASAPGAQVRDRSGSVHTLSTAMLDLAGMRLSDCLPPAPGGSGGRHVVLHWRPLADPAERILMTWAIRAGAAIVLVPEHLGVLYALTWCRPTVLQGTTEELARIAAGLDLEVGGASRRKLRRRFRRLSAVIVLDRQGANEILEPWRGLSAVPVSLPDLVQGGPTARKDLSREGELPDNMDW